MRRMGPSHSGGASRLLISPYVNNPFDIIVDQHSVLILLTACLNISCVAFSQITGTLVGGLV